MSLFELDFITFVIFLLFFYFITGFDTNFKALIVSELFWITLYIFVLTVSFILDDLILMSLIFFFLIFSAVDISIGIILILIQKKTLKINNSSWNSNFKINYNTRKNKFFFFKKIIY